MTLPEIQEELTGTMAASRTLCITCCHGLNWSSLLQLVFQHQACHSPSFFMTISMCGIGLPINLYTRIQIGETVRGILTHTIMLIYKLCWYVSLKKHFRSLHVKLLIAQFLFNVKVARYSFTIFFLTPTDFLT